MPEAKHKGFQGSKGTGLPETMILKNTVGTFSRHATYNNGKTLCLLWRGDVEEAKDANGDPMEVDLEENPLLYPCGPNWDSFDDGETAEHERGNEVFHEMSGAAKLCQALVDLGLEDDMLTRGDSMIQSSIYSGWDLYLERKEFDYGKNKEGQEMKTSRLMPTKVLGTGGDDAESKKKSKASTKKAKAKPAADDEDDEEAATGDILGNIDTKVLTKLKVAFKKADGDADAFADIAVDVDGVDEDDDLVTAIADGSLFEALNS